MKKQKSVAEVDVEKQKSVAEVDVLQKQKSVAEVDVVQDLVSVIHEHTLFFDKLVELIPAKFYLPTDDKEKPWFQGLSKAARAAAKKETKENIKKSRRDRLDPDKSSATTVDILKKSLGKEKVNDGDEEQGVVKPLMPGLEGDDRSMTYEALRQRLHSKLESFRTSRNYGDSNRARKYENRKVERGFQEKKRKRDNETNESKPAPDEPAEKVKKDAIEASKELVFGHVKLQNEEMQGKKRRVSKQKELERAKKLEEVKKNDPEKGEAIAKKESWKAAMNRASGIKVHDDPKLIKKSIQKGKKRTEKNAEKWKERVQTTHQLKAEKQKKRSENISGRIQEKKNAEKWKERVQTTHQLKAEKQKKRSENISGRIQEKKKRKIAKREKKLLRPGFEGRKDGFLNNSSG